MQSGSREEDRKTSYALVCCHRLA